MPNKQDNNENPKCFIRNILNKREQKIVDRELELLNIAETIISQEGVSGLTMDKLVATCDYSKGTVYNHFANKEDLYCALSIENLRFCISLTKRALDMDGTLREKCLGIYYAQQLQSRIRHTSSFCVLVAKTPAVRERASTGRLEIQEKLEQEITALIDELLSTAIANGDIAPRKKQHVNNLCFSLWSMSFGSNALLINAQEAQAISRLETEGALLFNINVLLDGMEWAPLSKECDYYKSWQRIGDEVFPQELATLQ